MTQGREPPALRPVQLPGPDTALPMDLTPESLIEKCEYFSSIGIWPSKVDLDPERWLGNFYLERWSTLYTFSMRSCTSILPLSTKSSALQ